MIGKLRTWRLRSTFLMLAILCLGHLGGCASINELRGPSASATLVEVPYEKQRTKYLCGLAVANMVSRYHGVPLAVSQHKKLEREATQNGGITGAVLKEAFRESGYNSVVFNGTLDHSLTGIYRHLDQGRPVIAMFMEKAGTPGHFVVLTGYDRTRELLVVLDPEIGRRHISRRRFLRQWEPSGRFTLLAVPQSITRNEGAIKAK